MTKQDALKTWEKAIHIKNEEDLFATFPAVERLREFWGDIKGLAWPENCGDSPWNLAACVAAKTVAAPTPRSSYLKPESYDDDRLIVAAAHYYNDATLLLWAAHTAKANGR